jgi:ParB family chromosome partitioning protein
MKDYTRRIEKRSVDSLFPYFNNSRTHSDEQVSQVAASIREFGFTNPILVDEDSGIIAGHGRLMAAKKIGLEEVPCIILDGLSDAQKKAYIIADNQLALNAGWDNESLRIELDDLTEAGFDIQLTGFTLDEMGALSFDSDSEVSMPEMPDGDREPFQHKTFTLHDEQVSLIDEAITLARTNPLSDTGLNENTNGNALALICGEWLSHGNG